MSSSYFASGRAALPLYLTKLAEINTESRVGSRKWEVKWEVEARFAAGPGISFLFVAAQQPAYTHPVPGGEFLLLLPFDPSLHHRSLNSYLPELFVRSLTFTMSSQEDHSLWGTPPP